MIGKGRVACTCVVSVRNLEGEAVEIKANLYLDLDELNGQVLHLWHGVPQVCQNLVQTEVSPVLHLGGDRPLAIVDMESVMDKIPAALGSSDTAVKLDVLRSVAKSAPMSKIDDDSELTESVISCLGDNDDEVRHCALFALETLSLGDRQKIDVITPVCNLLEDADVSIRQDAAKTLVQLACGDEDDKVAFPFEHDPVDVTRCKVAEGCASRLAHPKSQIVTEVVNLLAILASKDIGSVIGAVCKQLDHQNRNVRSTAIACLLQIAGKDNVDVIREIFKRLDGTVCEVPDSIVDGLTSLASKDNADVFSEAHTRLDSPQISVRVVALRLMSEFAGDDRDMVVEIALEMLLDSAAKVRNAALTVLLQLCPRGNTMVIEEICKMLEKPRPEVREYAIRALGQVVTTMGNKALFSEACKRLDHPRAEVRFSALKVIHKFFDRDDEAAIAAAEKMSVDPDDRVRVAALKMLGPVRAGWQRVMEAVEAS